MTQAQITRRTIARGAMWVAPTVVLAASTPAFAASAPVVLLLSSSCKVTAGGAEYSFTLQSNNGATQNAIVTITSVDINGTAKTGYYPTSQEYAPGPGIYVLHVPTTNMANGTAIITYDVVLADGTIYKESATFVIDQLPPCK